MNDELTDIVKFDTIRYANCWEDAEILLQGLAPAKESRILSIGSAGDNSFSLLTAHPAIVVAVDVNKIQLHLVELKRAAIKKLDHSETIKFLGFEPCDKRIEIFHHIKAELSADALSYWEANKPVIKAGLIYSGKFEKYLRLFSGRILPWIHSRKTVAQLFAKKNQAEQEAFYKNRWDSWQWKLLFQIFFSRYIMGKYGRDPRFMKEVDVAVSKNFYHKAALHLRSTAAQENFILHFSLTGSFGNFLPHYLEKENFKIIKSNLERLAIREGLAESAINYYGKFASMNLSNIFEYMNTQIFASTAEALLKGMEKNGKMGYWNLMVPRKISEAFPDKAANEKELSRILTQKDKGFFYNEFIVDKVK